MDSSFIKLDNFLMKKLNAKLHKIIPFKLKQYIKNNNCFIAGSAVLELIHNENYEYSDLDIFGSFENEEELYYNFRKNVNIYIYSYPYEKNYSNNLHIVRVYTCELKHKKIQLVILNNSFLEILNNFEKYCDIIACTSRIVYNKKFYIKAYLDKKTRLNPDYFDMITNKNSKYGNIYISKIYDRIEKYHRRGFKIDCTSINDFICGICYECLYIPYDIKKSTLYKTSCGHIYHFQCIYSWVNYDAGDEITLSKCSCPLCKTILIPKENIEINVYDIQNINIRDYRYIYCEICSYLFHYEREQETCGDSRTRVVCTECSIRYNMGSYDTLIGKKIICPHCGIELEHNGGCSQFTCCLYGADNCKGVNCNHGSSTNIKFCGYSWNILDENR